MKLATIAVLVLSVVFLGLSTVAAIRSTSAIANATLPPAARTGAPTEGTCASCHLSAPTSTGVGFFAVPTTGITEYTPGQTDSVGIVFNAPGVRWGFEVTVLKNSDNTMAGTINTFSDPPFSDIMATQTGAGRTYISHTSNGSTGPFEPNDGTWWGLGGGGWGFEWTAPPAGTGPVTFYLAGVAANGDQDDTAADTTYLFTLTLQEAGTTDVEPLTWGQIKKRYR